MNSLPSLDLITPCRNRAEDLKNSLPSWIACELINRIIVVDFNSSKPVIEELSGATNERLTVVRVEDEPLWRQGRAQNVGLALTEAQLVLKIDADVSVVDLHPYVEAMASDPTLFFTGFSKHGTSSGLCLAPRRKLRAIGGYHDHMSGWGGDDVDIYRRLKKRGLRREIFKAESFSEQGQKMATKTQKHLGWIASLWPTHNDWLGSHTSPASAIHCWLVFTVKANARTYAGFSARGHKTQSQKKHS